MTQYTNLHDLGIDPLLTARAEEVCKAITPYVQQALLASGVTDPENYHVAYTLQEIPHVR